MNQDFLMYFQISESMFLLRHLQSCSAILITSIPHLGIQHRK